MCKGIDHDEVLQFAIHDNVRKFDEHETTGTVDIGRPALRSLQNQLNCSVELGQKTVRSDRAMFEVPGVSGKRVLERLGMKLKLAFGHPAE